MKRKRSDSEISFCSSSMLSSPPQSNAMDIDMCMSPDNKYQNFPEITPSHLSSRTRKRFRDNRPSESTIHRTLPTTINHCQSDHTLTSLFETEHTLSLLFSAQKQPHIDPLPPNPMAVASTNPRPTDSTHQSSLHAFWALPSQNSSGASTPSSPPVNIRLQTKCEDCDVDLSTNDDNSMDLDFDLCNSSAEFGCSACGKQVCNSCSISNLGAERQCLLCAGKRRWIGGLGVRDMLFLNHFKIGSADSTLL